MQPLHQGTGALHWAPSELHGRAQSSSRMSSWGKGALPQLLPTLGEPECGGEGDAESRASKDGTSGARIKGRNEYRLTHHKFHNLKSLVSFHSLHRCSIPALGVCSCASTCKWPHLSAKNFKAQETQNSTGRSQLQAHVQCFSSSRRQHPALSCMFPKELSLCARICAFSEQRVCAIVHL